MTVSALPATVSYVEDGASVTFPVPYRFAASDLVVDRLIDGAVLRLHLGADYSVTGGDTDAGGTLTRTAATNGAILRIDRFTARAQPMVYTTGDRFPADSHEQALDRQMLIAQEQDAQQADLAARALMVAPGQTVGHLVIAPDSVVAFDSDGNPIAKPIGSFPAGPPGNANNTFDTRSDLAASSVDNGSGVLLERGFQGTFSWTAGDFTGAVDGFDIIASSNTAITIGAWVRQNASGAVNVRNYGAIGNGAIDDTAALLAAVAAANALKLPVHVPTGRYVLNATIQPKYGIVGSGSALTRLMATNASAFGAGIPMIRIGWKQSEDPGLCFAVPVRGLSLYGAGVRTAARSNDQSTMLFNGDGLFFDEQAHSCVADDIEVAFFRRNVDFGGIYGHLSTNNLVSSNGWYNIYYSRNAFDYKHINPTITGALFACIGASGALDESLVQAVGGIGGMTILGGHTGFSPFGIRVEAGDGGIGLLALTCIDTRFEFIGNRAVDILDASKNSGILDFKSPGHSWARDVNNNPDERYAIVGDSGVPTQDYAVVLGNISGSAAPSYRRGDQWKVGSTGKHTKIANLFDFWHDDKGIGGYEVVSGQERLIFAGQFGFTASVGVAPQTVNATSGARITIADFSGANEIPEAYDGTPQARLVLAAMVASASADVGVQVIVKVNGGADAVIGAFVLRQGENIIPAEHVAFPIGRRTAGAHAVQALLAFAGSATVNINNRGLGGEARLVLGQQGGIA